jgi:hypothetical protein
MCGRKYVMWVFGILVVPHPVVDIVVDLGHVPFIQRAERGRVFLGLFN